LVYILSIYIDVPFDVETFIVDVFVVSLFAVDTFDVDAFVVPLFDVDAFTIVEFVVPLFAVDEFDVDEFDIDEFDVDEFDVDVFDVDELDIDEFAFETFNVVNVIEGKLILLTFKLLTLRTDVELPQFIIVVVSVNKLTTFGGDLDCIASICSSFAVITPPSITPPAPSSYEIIPFIDFVIYALFVCVDIYILTF
jgi:hypothetical protein